MTKIAMAALAALLLMGTFAYAQMQDQTGPQKEMSVVGKITDFDLARGRLTLDNGFQFSLAPSFEFTSSPAVGQKVEVIYDEQGGQKVAHSIDQSFEGQSHSSS